MAAAVKLNSWNDFRLRFGGFLPYGYLAYAVRGFFATGGQTCYVVRVGAAAKPAAQAVLPLPAAIISQNIANLSRDVLAGETKITFDVPVTLERGRPIVIGNPASNGQVCVASVIDGKTIMVEPALDVSHAAGEPIFARSGPATAAPVTSIVSGTSAGQTQIRLDCSQVSGVEIGSLIALGDPVTGECVSVAGVLNDQVIVVQPALESKHAAGELVYPVSGSALASAAPSGLTILQVSNGASFAQNDLIGIEGSGRHEFHVVSSLSSDSKIQLGRPLRFDYDIGARVRKYDTAFTVTALYPGEWGNRIKLQIVPLDRGNAVNHFSLRVTVDPDADLQQPLQQEYYPFLSLDPKDPTPAEVYAPCVVKNLSGLIQIDVPGDRPGTFLLANAGPLETSDLYLEGGSDGAPATQASAQPPDVVNQDFQDALDVLRLVDEIAILCCPDAVASSSQVRSKQGWSTAAIQKAMVDQCVALQYRIAILDTPPSFTADSTMTLQPGQALTWLKNQEYSRLAARFTAIYYPWLKVPVEMGTEGLNRSVPPCGHVAGAYAFTDNQSGVQKPPANVELHFVSDVELAVTNQQQAFLNQEGINAIRPIAGRGIRVWGARSLSKDSDWTYIHTRRLMSMIEDSVEKASRWVVFQNNDDDLRRMLTHSLNVFLESIRVTGGLKGLRPSDSYFVKCDATNNTPATIDAGQLVCRVGVAISAPMEFLVFDIRRSVAGAQVVEA